ncbi:MAG: hypothetical protein ACXWNB_02605 [Candidatus Binataceae bacterium]
MFIVGDPDDSPAADREGSNRAELYETAAGAFVELGPLLHKRGGGCALTLLNDGRVLVSGVSRSDAELFDPATRRFSPAGSMNNVHCGVDPLLLNDGTVLFAGNDFNRRGDAPQTIEIYHPPPR